MCVGVFIWVCVYVCASRHICVCVCMYILYMFVC